MLLENILLVIGLTSVFRFPSLLILQALLILRGIFPASILWSGLKQSRDGDWQRVGVSSEGYFTDWFTPSSLLIYWPIGFIWEAWRVSGLCCFQNITRCCYPLIHFPPFTYLSLYVSFSREFKILPNSRSNQNKNQIKPKIWRGSIIGWLFVVVVVCRRRRPRS